MREGLKERLDKINNALPEKVDDNYKIYADCSKETYLGRVLADGSVEVTYCQNTGFCDLDTINEIFMLIETLENNGIKCTETISRSALEEIWAKQDDDKGGKKEFASFARLWGKQFLDLAKRVEGFDVTV